MKHTEKKYIPAKIIEQVCFRTCDKCSQTITKGSMFDYVTDEIRFDIGECYPETDYMGERYTMDICSDCLEKLIIMMNDNGFNLTLEHI